MISSLKSVIKASDKPLGTIVHIGAGSGNSLLELCRLQPESVVAIESSEVLFASLQRKAKKFNKVKVINEWVFPVGHLQQNAYFFNNPRYNSLNEPHDLTKMLPNIKLVNKKQVKGIPLDNLLDEITFSNDKLNLLALTVQGGEYLLLNGTKYEAIQSIDYILLQSPEAQCYKETPTLEVENFDRVASLSGISCLTLYKQNHRAAQNADTLARKVKEIETLNNQVEQLKNESKQLKLEKQNLKHVQSESCDKLAAFARDLKNANEKYTSLESQIKSLKEQRDKQEAHHLQNKAWAEELHKKNCVLTNRLTEAEELASARKEQLDLLEEQLVVKTEEITTSLAERKELHEKVAKLNNSLENVEKEKETQKAHHLRNKEWAEGLNEAILKKQLTIDSLETQIKALESTNRRLMSTVAETEKREQKLSATLEVNSKLMTKIEADNAHLLQQYREKVQSEAELKKLITDLHQKLQQAAAFYHTIEQQHPELLIKADK